MVILARIALSASHPGLAFQGSWHEADFIFWTKFAFQKPRTRLTEVKYNPAMSDEESEMRIGVAEVMEVPARKWFNFDSIT